MARSRRKPAKVPQRSVAAREQPLRKRAVSEWLKAKAMGIGDLRIANNARFVDGPAGHAEIF
jgi:hypothetical protein